MIETNKAKIEEFKDWYVVDDRYLIYRDGRITDNDKAGDIPAYVFRIRDTLSINKWRE
tara:strand:+ start:648 stop:821 length:174 start_codon:yes stop_codon:yes gene_type:complete